MNVKISTVLVCYQTLELLVEEKEIVVLQTIVLAMLDTLEINVNLHNALELIQPIH
jgi:hypothetical protein